MAKDRIRILFVCHGNICRSTMAQCVMQHMVDSRGIGGRFTIDSVATTNEEIGMPIKKHPSVKALLLLKDRDKILPENRTGSMSLREFAQERRDTYILPRLRTLYPAEEGES